MVKLYNYNKNTLDCQQGTYMMLYDDMIDFGKLDFHV